MIIHYWDTHIPYNSPEEYIKSTQNSGILIEEVLDKINDSDRKRYLRETMGGSKKQAR